MSNTNLSLMTEAFNRLGITIEYRYRPDCRSIIEANNGMVAFSLNPEIDLSSYRIGDNDYHIGYMHGWVNVRTFECT
ncbi:MAG: hypothetical protein HRU22_13885, partial [Gammaproteobacteria bacterium]|nr:hypothetical protein [Gammaproteobacteria bacterium]